MKAQTLALLLGTVMTTPLIAEETDRREHDGERDRRERHHNESGE